MAAYRRVFGFGHLTADCRGPGSAPEPYACCEHGTTYTDKHENAKAQSPLAETITMNGNITKTALQCTAQRYGRVPKVINGSRDSGIIQAMPPFDVQM